MTIHTTHTAPEGSREALVALERNIGFIPSLAGTIAGSPVAHSAFAAKAGGSPEPIAALRAGEPLEDERLESIRRFTVDRVADGLDPEETLEVVAQIAYTTLANLAANAAETPIDDAFLAAAPA
jgi:hypothetical protein